MKSSVGGRLRDTRRSNGPSVASVGAANSYWFAKNSPTAAANAAIDTTTATQPTQLPVVRWQPSDPRRDAESEAPERVVAGIPLEARRLPRPLILPTH